MTAVGFEQMALFSRLTEMRFLNASAARLAVVSATQLTQDESSADIAKDDKDFLGPRRRRFQIRDVFSEGSVTVFHLR
jgi:hypothetical protein